MAALNALGEIIAGIKYLRALGGEVPLLTNDKTEADRRANRLAGLYSEMPNPRGRFDLSKMRLDTNDDPQQYRVPFMKT